MTDDMPELPPLPTHDVLLRGDQTTHFVPPYHEPLWRDISLYGAEKMLAYGRACMAAGMEKSKAIADSYTKHHASATAHYEGRWQDAKEYHSARMDAGSQIRDAIAIAAAIRKAKD